MMNSQRFTQGSAALEMPASTTFSFEILGGMRIASDGFATAGGNRDARLRRLFGGVCCTMCLIGLLGAFLCAGMHVINGERMGYEQALATAARTREPVAPGDSLWSMARAHPIAGLRVAQVSDIIRAWNRLDGATLTPGEILIVPDVGF